MKALILTISALVMSSTSHGLIADRFKCTLEIKDITSDASTKTDKDFFIARLPLSARPAPDVRITGGQTMETVALDTPRAEFQANLNFYYKHAVKIDGAGKPKIARQLTCIGLTGSYCEKGSGDGMQICGTTTVACSETQDPFDPTNGWSPTAIVGDISTFNEQTLGPATANISDENGKNVGVVNLNCQFMGSFQ